MLGLQFHTTQPLVLAKRQQSGVWLLMKEDNFVAAGSHLGIVATGTVLQVDRMIKVTELCEWMVFPVYFTWDCTMARIEGGPYAGKEIGIAGEGLSLEPGAVTLGNSSLHPVDQDFMIAALYRIPGFHPSPAKYIFYDSNSNQLATVTMILPDEFWGDKLNGMWFGSLSKSYVRPKSDYVLASDKLNVHDLHPFTSDFDVESKSPVAIVDLNPDEPDDQITVFMPISETNAPVSGWWGYATDAGEVDHGTFTGPVH